jgi:hypothetical protein
VYINGVQEAYSDSMIYDPPPNDAITKIGCRNNTGDDPFNGAIDDIRIYNKALSAEEILQLYEESFPPVELAIVKINTAIAEKKDASKKIWSAFEKEAAAIDALDELLDSGDYGDLKKGDIIKAMEKTHSAVQHEEQSQKDLEKSIEKLEDALEALGVEPEPEPPPLDPNLIAWWKLDDGQGYSATDVLGISNGTLYGNTQWVPGRIGPTALSFDGSGDYVDCGNDSSLNLGTSNFTISAWINVRSVPVGLCPGIVSKWQDLNNRWYFHVFGPDYIQFTSKTNGNFVYYVNTDHFLSFNQWYHVCFVADGLGKIYVNGQDRTTGVSYTPASLSNNATLKIGYNGYTGSQQYFDGMIDDVRIYDRALSAAEVQALYQAGL